MTCYTCKTCYNVCYKLCTTIQYYCYITLQITILIADSARFSVQCGSHSCTSYQQTLLPKTTDSKNGCLILQCHQYLTGSLSRHLKCGCKSPRKKCTLRRWFSYLCVYVSTYTIFVWYRREISRINQPKMSTSSLTHLLQPPYRMLLCVASLSNTIDGGAPQVRDRSIIIILKHSTTITLLCSSF